MKPEQIKALPHDQARAALDALPPIIRNLPAYRTLADELARNYTRDTTEQTWTKPEPTPEPAAEKDTWRENWKETERKYHEKKQPAPSASTLEIVQWCAAERIPAELVGRWVWVEFAEKPDAGTIGKMKARGFRWIAKRGRWAHDCGHKSRRGKGDPRDKYGRVEIEEAARRLQS